MAIVSRMMPRQFSTAIYYLVVYFLVVLGGGALYFYMASNMEEQIHSRFQMDARARLHSIDEVLKSATNKFRSYTEIPTFRLWRYHDLTLNRTAVDEDIRNLELFFFDLQREEPSHSLFGFVGMNGSEVFRVQDGVIADSLQDLSLSRQFRRSLTLGKDEFHVFLDDPEEERATLTWWFPVDTSPTVRLGFLRVKLEFAAINRVLDSLVQSESDFVSLIDDKGETLYSNGHQQAGAQRWSAEHSLRLPGLDLYLTYSASSDDYLESLNYLNYFVLYVVMPLLGILFVLLAMLSYRRTQADQAISRMAYFDSLTGLVNRNMFDERLQQAIVHTRETGIKHALLFIDLDQFKVINDSCGHLAGDQMLKELSLQMKRTVRQNDTLARLSGDEYALLMEGCSLDRATTEAEQIRNLVGNFRFTWGGKFFSVGASIGVALISEEPGNAETVLSQADMACHMAKELGRNRIYVYADDDRDLARRRNEMQWISRLKTALAQDGFFLECQRIVPTDLNSSEVCYWEMLVRILEDGEVVYPDAFIPAAERYGLMPQIDRWVVNHAFSLFRELASAGNPRGRPTMFFINISGASLSDNGFLDYVRRGLEKYGIEADKICFEITETAAVSNLAIASNFIGEVNKLGCSMALDDFGSGLCSFNYLKNLPVSYLKIDGSFVRRMLEDEMDSVIVTVIKQIGDAASLSTIAEFVPDKQVLARLAEIGIDYAQGYGISRPQPVRDLFQECADSGTVGDAVS